MSDLWRSMKQALFGAEESAPQPSSTGEAAGPTARVVRTRTINLPPEQRLPQLERSHYEVRLEPKPYWQQMGWIQRGNEYCGEYQPLGRRFSGRIVYLYANRWDFFVRITKPWPEFENHIKAPCFVLIDTNGWRQVHWRVYPASLDAGIQDIEKTLAEALTRRR